MSIEIKRDHHNGLGRFKYRNAMQLNIEIEGVKTRLINQPEFTGPVTELTNDPNYCTPPKAACIPPPYDHHFHMKINTRTQVIKR